jgi:hypothetical protein
MTPAVEPEAEADGLPEVDSDVGQVEIAEAGEAAIPDAGRLFGDES